MSALLSGSVECQLTTSPYVYKEATDDSIHEVEGVAEAWPDGNSFVVAVASTSLKEKNPELYDAFIKALAEAIDYINNNKEEVAQMLCAEEGVDAETMLECLRAYTRRRRRACFTWRTLWRKTDFWKMEAWSR